jgi:hypothetical protein
MERLPLSPEAVVRVRAVLDGAAIDTLQSAAELHYAARAWNWDDASRLVDVVRRPDCTLATAAMLFWRSLPDEVIGHFANRKAAHRAGESAAWDLQAEIRDGVAAGRFAAGIGYDPADDGGTDWTEDWPDDKPVPEALLRAVPGPSADPSLRF